MKNWRLLTFLACIASIQLHAQSPENPLVAHIPADADKVYHINYTAIAAKLDLQSLVAVMPKSEKNQEMMSYIADPGKAGVDARFGMIIAQSNVAKLDSPRYTTILIALSDSAKFIKFLREANAKKEKDKLVIHPGKPRAAVQGSTVYAWNDKMVAITTVKPPVFGVGQTNLMNPKPAGEATLAKYLRSATRRSVMSLTAISKSTLAADAEFRAALTDDADAHIYSRFGSGFGMMADLMRMTKAPVNQNFVTAMDNLKKLHMHSLGTIRFENGKMSLRNRIFYDSLNGLDFGLRPINAGLVERLPQGNLLGLFAVHFDPAAYLNIMTKMSGGMGLHTVDSMLSKTGLTTKDIFAAFKGDLLVAAIDNGATIPATDSTPVKPAKPGVFVVLTIADKAAFAKLDNLIHLTRDSAAAAADTSVKFRLHLAHTLRDDILVFGPSQQATDSYANNTGHTSSRLLSEEVRSAPVALALDVKAIGNYLQPMLAKAGPQGGQAQIVFQLFDQIIFTSGQMHGNEMDLLFEIKMADQQQNSLTTISKLIQSMSQKK